ncbi:MAG: non-heme iron oxygenase ferredoxin subunit [Candidatus Caldarchaeum sp.]
MSNLLKVCAEAELPEGEMKVVAVDDEQILVLRHKGKVYAVSNICPHEYAELSNGIVIDETITCPVHLSRFVLSTGEVLNPPAVRGLKTYRVHVVEGEIFVEV